MTFFVVIQFKLFAKPMIEYGRSKQIVEDPKNFLMLSQYGF
jgi:hypothetical protein